MFLRVLFFISIYQTKRILSIESRCRNICEWSKRIQVFHFAVVISSGGLHIYQITTVWRQKKWCTQFPPSLCQSIVVSCRPRMTIHHFILYQKNWKEVTIYKRFNFVFSIVGDSVDFCRIINIKIIIRKNRALCPNDISVVSKGTKTVNYIW